MEVCSTVLEGVNGIHKLQPGLSFLDLQIHDETGFEFLKQLNKRDFEVIFTTALMATL